MIFDGLKQPKTLTSYNLMKGITDFGNAAQWNLYEGGYSFLMVVSIPRFLEVLGSNNTDTIQPLLDNYVHVLEHEFKGLSGVENITAEQMEIGDGLTTLKLINKVNQQSETEISMTYTEKSGSLLTKVNELFLKGIKDPKSGVKTYHGLIQEGLIEPGFDKEVFSFLYFVTDNTATKIERAFLALCAQPTSAQFDIYNSTRGDYANKEIEMAFSCFLIEGTGITSKAVETLAYMNSSKNPNKWHFDSNDFSYTGISAINPEASHF
jgi:hypothetical protein